MGIISKIKAGLATAVALALGVLYFMLGQRTRQRDQQRQRADRAEQSHAASETRRADERRISKAQADAREQNKQAEIERNAKPKDTRRTGRLGGAGRVRDYDAED